MLQSVTNKGNESGESFTRQGSLRRVLPSGHNKENLFGRQNEDLNKFYRTFHQEYIIMAEYKMILSENIKGVYVIPSRESPLLWFGVIFVRSGFFENGVFRFNIQLDENFPDCKHPKVVFQSELHHPVIDAKSNELNLLGGFPTWSKTEQHLWQVLKYVHWSFHNVLSSAQHSVNEEALNLLRSNEAAFREKAKQCVQVSRDRLYDKPAVEDKHYITFEQYVPHVHDSVRREMLAPADEERVGSLGHSWVKHGSFRPMSREPSEHSESES